MSYLLDANVFIEAKNRYYGFDFCPAFWNWILQSNENGRVFSIDMVATELAAGADELSVWAQSDGANLFLPTDAEVAAALPAVSAWATSQNYDAGAINTFFQAADYYLVAHALAGGHIVVTQEVASPSQKRIKIPNACIGLSLKFMTPFQMLRIEQARFLLGGAP